MPSGRLALFYRSGALWFACATFGLPLALGADAILSLWGWRLDPPEFVTWSTIRAFYGVSLLLFCVTRRAFRRRLREHWFALCPTCMYPLKRETGRCTECGRTITRHHARMYWIGMLLSPYNMFRSEGDVIKDARIWRDHRSQRLRAMNWRFGLLPSRRPKSDRK